MMVVDRAMGLVSVLILARLLTPTDFGLVAMCMSVIAGLQIFTAFGFDVVLIQDQNASREHYDTVFTFNVLFGVLFALAIVALANVTSVYYKEPRVALPMMILAAGFFVRSFENIKVVDFRKDLELKKEAILRISQKLAGFCVTVTLAYYLESYWALVIGMVWMHVFSVALSYGMKPYRPRLTFAKAREIFSFSGWVFVNNTLLFIEERFADFLVGSRLGARSLGLLNMSMEIGSTPATQLISSVNRAVYPGYAKLADDRVELAKTFLMVLCGISIVAMPIGIGIASVSSLIVPVMLGDKWVDATPLLAILGAYSVVAVMLGNTSYIFYALGKPRLVTLFTLIHVLMLVPIIFFFVSALGIVGAAWGLLLTGLVSFPVIMFMVKRQLPISVSAIAGALWRSTAAAAVMFFSVTYLIRLEPDLPDALLLIGAMALGAVAYTSALGLLILTTGFRDLKEWGLITDTYEMGMRKFFRRS